MLRSRESGLKTTKRKEGRRARTPPQPPQPRSPFPSSLISSQLPHAGRRLSGRLQLGRRREVHLVRICPLVESALAWTPSSPLLCAMD